MTKSIARTLLVVGEDYKEIIKKYDAETEVDKYLVAKRERAEKMYSDHIKFVESVLKDGRVPLTEQQKDLYRLVLGRLKEISAEQYFKAVTKGCTYDENGDAYSTKNPDAKYWTPRMYQNRLLKTGEEGYFSNPFVLKDGSKSYVAKFNDIDWGKMHLNNQAVYRAAWELVVDGRKPENEKEEGILQHMGERKAYFANFADVDEYVVHSTAFWTYGIIDADGKYTDADDVASDIDWVREYYPRFIEPLKENNPMLAIYEVRICDDKDLSEALFDEI